MTDREQATHAPYRREPYVRATLDDGSVVDGNATAWTATWVNVKWYDPDVPYAVVAGIQVHMHSAWVPAEHVEGIRRSESAWQDVYDEPGHE
jgi:hypothetical protein